MTTIALGSSIMPLLPPRSAIHPVLRSAMQETGRLCALMAGYAALIALFALAAVSVWGNLPSAVAESKLVPGFSATDGPMKLRGSL
jgi:hypothetical protein